MDDGEDRRGEGGRRRYSLEHVEGIRNKSQGANGVPYLCKTDLASVILEVAQVAQADGARETEGLRTGYEL